MVRHARRRFALHTDRGVMSRCVWCAGVCHYCGRRSAHAMGPYSCPRIIHHTSTACICACMHAAPRSTWLVHTCRRKHGCDSDWISVPASVDARGFCDRIITNYASKLGARSACVTGNESSVGRHNLVVPVMCRAGALVGMYRMVSPPLRRAERLAFEPCTMLRNMHTYIHATSHA